ncbi:MAG: response regulator [Burkholderiales bacterium]|nr:response regulator [Burkholderiales bacterium]
MTGQRSEPATADQHPADAVGVRPARTPEPAHVLVVDDDDVMNRYIAAQLRRAGYRVTCAGDGASALASVRREVPDLVILDHYLPDTTGEQLLEALRADSATRDTPIIYLTIDGSRHRFRKTMTAGADDFLPKPFQPQELVDAVRAQLRRAYARMIWHDEERADADVGEVARLAGEMRSLEARLTAAYEERGRTLAELAAANTRIDQRVAQKTRMLERQNQALRSYGYALAHELRRPLRGILGFAGMLLSTQRAELDADAARMLGRIEQSGRRMNEFIEGLLVMAEADAAGVRRAPVDLSAMARAIVDEDPDATRGVVRIAPDLVADADPVLARIVMENLMSNARKYSARGACPLIEVDACDINGERFFYVRDNGAGFDMGDAGKLFQPFQRLHPTARYDGLGIGLATVKQIIDRHHGRIWAKGGLGEGATFFFSFAPTPSSGEAPGTEAPKSL